MSFREDRPVTNIKQRMKFLDNEIKKEKEKDFEINSCEYNST